MPYRWTVLTRTLPIAVALLFVWNLPGSAASEVGAVINAPAYTEEGRFETIDEMLPADGEGPKSVKVLRWMFVTSRYRDRFRSIAGRLLGARR